MNINFFIIGLIYLVTEEWMLIGAAPKAKGKPPKVARTFSLTQKKEVVKEFKVRYYPVLDEYWEVFGDHKDVMKSAMGCMSMAFAYPFLSTFRLILLGIGYGMSQDTFQDFMLTDGSATTYRNTIADEYVDQFFTFNDLAHTVSRRPEERNVYKVIESTDVTLKDLFKTLVTGANQFSTLVVNAMGSSLKSCLDVVAQIKNNSKLMQDFVDVVTGREKAPARSSGDEPGIGNDAEGQNEEGGTAEAGSSTPAATTAAIRRALRRHPWRSGSLPGEYRDTMKRIDFVCRDKNATAGSGKSRASSSGRSSSGKGFFGSGRKKDNDPFSNCSKTDLRDERGGSNDDYDYGGHYDGGHYDGGDDGQEGMESWLANLNPFR